MNMFKIDEVLWCEFPWLDLLNSDWHDHRGSYPSVDRLEIALWRRHFFSRWHYTIRGIPHKKLMNSLHELRTILRSIAEKYAQHSKPSPADWHRINRYLVRAPYIRRIKTIRTRLNLFYIPRTHKLDALLGNIAGSFAETIVQGDPDRIKICQNKNCRWVFNDHSKNKSRKWCDDTCGNLMKIHRYRGR